uniref:Multiple inositol polyphosphate phosphatase 1 n=1 Tax=Aceria tosichella TaxID=561515 RepID=A0A6G1SAM4_9ACAR
MKPNKRTPRATGENTNSNELDEQSNTSARVTTTPGGATEKSYNDQIDHSQEEQQQVGLLASELIEGKGDTRRITTRLSALVPNIMVKSHHQKSFDSNSVPAETRNASTAARRMKKMLRDDDNNSTRQSGADVDLESNGKTTKRFFSKAGCCVALLMAITIIATLVVFFCHSPKILDSEDRCLNQNGPSQNYKLFSTKTLYDTAVNYLNKFPTPTLSVNSSQQQNNHQKHYHYDKSSVNIPKIFESKESLETIHRRLTQERGCTLSQFHFIGRHAARTPDADDIKKINTLIANVKSRIDLSRIRTEQAVDSDHKQTPSPTSSSSGVVVTETEHGSQEVCHDPLVQLSRWSEFTRPEYGDMVTEAGFHESEQLALRLKTIFPEVFNGSQANIRFGTTKKLRTAQTAVSFLKHMVNHSINQCKSEHFPAVDTRGKAKVDEIESNDCILELLKKHSLESLSFHKTCDDITKKGDDYTVVPLGLRNDTTTEFIARSVSERLQLTGQNMLTSEEARAIYDVCRYESAQLGETSIWCHLFKDTDLTFYEYMADVADFFDVYGDSNQVKSTCRFTEGLFKSFPSAKVQSNVDSKIQANFYFTHSAVIQKLIAASVDLSKDNAYNKRTVKDNLVARNVPSDRQWRSSLLSPFSANIAFTIYNCANSPLHEDTSGSGKPQEFTVSPFHLVASLNEQPIILAGCKHYECDLVTLGVKSKLFRDREECDYEDICKSNTIAV